MAEERKFLDVEGLRYFWEMCRLQNNEDFQTNLEIFEAMAAALADIVDGTTPVAEATHAENAAKAADADQLGGKDPGHYATAESVTDLKEIARTGSIYDVEEASEDTNGVRYLILDCNW